MSSMNLVPVNYCNGLDSHLVRMISDTHILVNFGLSCHHISTEEVENSLTKNSKRCGNSSFIR